MTAKQIDFYYLFLITGQDYPIKPNSDIEGFLERANGKEFIEHFPLPRNDGYWAAESGGVERIEHWHFRYFNKYICVPSKTQSNSGIKSIIHVMFNVVFKKRVFPEDLTPFAGSSYWCITRECACFIKKFINDDPQFTQFFQYVNIPDEIIFQTIFLNSGFSHNVINDNLRYVDWSDLKPSPRILRTSDFEGRSRSSALIARKFDVNVDSDILDSIDEKLL